MIDVHVAANLFYPELPGGANQYFRYGPFLRERGVQLRVHTIKKPHHEESELEVHGIKIRRYECPPNSTFFDDLQMFTCKAIDAIAETPGKAILQPMGTTAATPGSVSRLWKARLQGIPSCFHYTMVPVVDERPFPGNLKTLLYTKGLVSPYRKLLMCSHVMGRAFEDVAGISSRRIEAIPNGIDISVFSPVEAGRKRQLREQFELPADDPVVLYVGSVIPRKGVDILIQAWAKVLERKPRARLVIVGSIRPRQTVRDTTAVSENERYFEDIGKQLEELSDPKSVIFVGETDQIQEYYRAADLFAFAAHREGLPSVVLEAMACSIPCVVAPFIGLPDDGEEYGVSGEHFLRSSHDPATMSEDICRLLEDEPLRSRMGAAGVEWIRDTQEMGKAADRLAAVYKEMVDGG